MVTTIFDKDDIGLHKLMAAGLVAAVPDQTSVLVLSGGGLSLQHVRVLEGDLAGEAVWVNTEWVKGPR
ncbi:MAG TPA: hypothetical protein VFF73_10170, partial [Planctomycetota bacterium]|nr:hypothetical protein [Planctomycetota bacterium]